MVKLSKKLRNLATDVAMCLNKNKPGPLKAKVRDAFDLHVDKEIQAGSTSPTSLDVAIETIRKLRSQLQTVVKDCNMALDGTWDRGDHGFEATREACWTAIDEANATLKQLR